MRQGRRWRAGGAYGAPSGRPARPCSPPRGRAPEHPLRDCGAPPSCQAAAPGRGALGVPRLGSAATGAPAAEPPPSLPAAMSLGARPRPRPASPCEAAASHKPPPHGRGCLRRAVLPPDHRAAEPAARRTREGPPKGLAGAAEQPLTSPAPYGLSRHGLEQRR